MNNLKKEKYFLYVGNAYPHKNLKKLIQAIVLLNRKGTKFIELKIVSSRSVFINRLEGEIKKLRAEKYIQLLGFISDDKLAGLYKEAEAFVFPSLSEGFGIPGVEAMENGTLLLASDIPVFREIYQDNAFYFNPNESSSISSALEKALAIKPKTRDFVIKKSQKFIKRYSWSRMAEETLKLYSKVGKNG